MTYIRAEGFRYDFCLWDGYLEIALDQQLSLAREEDQVEALGVASALGRT